MMKINSIFSAVLLSAGIFLGSFGFAYATSTFSTQQGGTGTTTPTGILYGDGTLGLTSIKTTTIGSGLLFTGGTLSATGSGGSAYPFPLTGNATSTLTQFNGGLTAYASTTIGNGTQAGGLTVNGGATTTGNLFVQGSATIGSLSGVLNGTSGVLSAAVNGTDYTLVTAKTCTSGDFVSAVTAAGVFTCMTPTGGGSAYPFALTGNATSTLTQFNGGLTAYASTTIGDGTATGGFTVSGSATVVGTDSNVFSVGGTNKAFVVDNSAANAATGIKVTSNSAGNIAIISALSTNSSEGLRLTSKGTGSITLSVNGNNRIAASNSGGQVLGTFSASGLSTLTGGFLAFATSTVGDGTQAGGLTISGGATTTGNALFSGTIKTILSDGCVQASSGLLTSTGSACGSGSGSAFPFTADSYAGVGVNSTTTGLWLKATSPYSLMASSSVLTYASSTAITSPSLFSSNIYPSGAGTISLYASPGSLNFISTDGYRLYPDSMGSNSYLGIASAPWTYASTTQFTAGSSNLFYVNSSGEVIAYDKTTGNQGQLSPMRYLSVKLATTTAWTGTSSEPYSADVVMPFAGTLQNASCKTDTGTLNVLATLNSNNLQVIGASTTAGLITYSSKTFTAGQTMKVDAGTPASTPTWITCTFGATITP